jgi:hypothetical protein
MSEQPTTEPAVQKQPPGEEPRGAIIEIVERHSGEKYPYTGAGSVICPNHLRINGVAVWATYDAPATIHEINLSSEPGTPFTVTVQLFARALNIGGTPTFDPGVLGGPDSNSAAVVEIPDTASALESGEKLDRPYVLLNGQRLYTDGDIVIGEIATDGDGRTAATVTLTLLCRRLTVDDEPYPPAGTARR